MTIEPIVRMKNISKWFGGVNAVNDVSFEIVPGIVHGIVGENGAGKSTLMRVLGGFHPDYKGEIYFNGDLVHVSTPAVAQNHGIALVHQELSLVPELTVAENIFLGREFCSPITRLIQIRQTRQNAKNLLQELEADVDSREKLANLSIAKQQLVEIAKGVSMKSNVLILDEPTSSLTAPEISDLFKIIRKLKKMGSAIIYISHKLPEIFEITDEVTVLRDGNKVEHRFIDDWNEASLVKAMVGRELSTFFSNSHVYKPKKVALEVKNLSRKPYFKDVNFKVYEGEVLGIYGLVGAGRTELAETITGLAKKDDGEIYVNGNLRDIKNSEEAKRNKIALVPEDRRIHGLHFNFSVKNNLSLPSLGRLSNFGFIKMAEERDVSKRNVEEFNIRTSSVDSLISTLSGGNQQKVVLGKWLNTDPEILILDDPTRGIDVGAKAEIRKLIDQLAGEGRAIILISSELPEISCMSDRILVMCEGQITGEFLNADCDEEILGTYAAGVKSYQDCI